MSRLVFPRGIRAVLLDVDGTLYDQSCLRLLMAFELCRPLLSKRSFRSVLKTWRTIAHFRAVRENLRSLGEPEGCLARLQYLETAKQTGEEPVVIESVVSEWLYQRPLKYLRFCRRHGIEEFFAFLEQHNLQIGVFSDYPVLEKLQVLGLADWISVALCAIDPEINAFKPHPKGFLRACAIWGLFPEEVLYIGDRIEVDAVGAASAGLPCAILARTAGKYLQRDSLCNYVTYSSFAELQWALANN
jgi:HAD superfamily hydrolase (TIGR01549 family)